MSLDSPLQPATDPIPGAPDDSAEGFSSGAAKRAARNATALALSSVLAKGLLFVWQIILARWLGSEGYGTYGTIGAMLSIGAAIPEFGMGLIVVRDVATRPQDAGRFLAATLVMQPALAGVGYGVLLLSAVLLGYDSRLIALLALAALSLGVDALGNMCHNQLIAIERMVLTALIAAGHILALIMLVALALALGGGLWGLYVATISAGLLRAGVYWLFTWGRFDIRPIFPVDRTLARRLLVDGWPLALSSFLVLAYQHSDKLLTTALIGEASTGQLTASFVIVFGVIELLSTTILVAVFPLMSRTYGSGMREMFDFMLEKLAFFNLTLSLPIAIFTSLLAVSLSSLVFGPDYTRTADVLQVLIWYTVVTMVANVFSKALLIQNRQRRLLVIRMAGLALNIALNLVLLPALGVAGAAVATLIAEIVILVAILRSFDFAPDWWARTFNHVWRLALAGAGLAAVVLLLRAVHPLLAAGTGAPVYIGLVLFSGAIARDDWDLIYRLAIAMPGGSIIGRYWKRQLT
jgi:O-antigen/teichoic acid export membrane protein